MSKQTARGHKRAVHHAHAAPRQHRRAVHAKAVAKVPPAPAVTIMAEPKPQIIEVMELDFVDPDLVPYKEEALVGAFDDEDL